MILRSHIASKNRTNIMRIRFDFSRNFDWYILNKIHSIYYKIVGKISIGFNRFFLSFLYFGKSIIVCLCVCVCVCPHTHTLSHVRLFVIPWTAARQAALSMEFSCQEHWGGLPFSPPGNLTHPGIKSTSIGRQTLYNG